MSAHADRLDEMAAVRWSRSPDGYAYFPDARAALAAGAAALREVEALRAELATLREDARLLARYSDGDRSVPGRMAHLASRRILATPAPAQPTCEACGGTGRVYPVDAVPTRSVPCHCGGKP